MSRYQVHLFSNVKVCQIFIVLQKRVSDRFPNPLGDLAKGFAKEELNKSRRKSTIEFSRDKIHSLLKEVLHGHKVDDQVNVYLVAVLHYIASDILKVGPTLDFDMVTNFDVFAFQVAGNFVKNKRHQVITCQDIKIAMKADKVNILKKNPKNSLGRRLLIVLGNDITTISLFLFSLFPLLLF